MVTNNKVLTVSYGTFSCTLEGFDDSFDTMKAIAEYFRDLAADDRYFGAEPPTPDAEMLARIAEREVERRVQARTEHGAIVLTTDMPEQQAPAPVELSVEDAEEPATATADEAPGPVEDMAPDTNVAEAEPEVEEAEPEVVDVTDSVLEAVALQSTNAPEIPEAAEADEEDAPTDEDMAEEVTEDVLAAEATDLEPALEDVDFAPVEEMEEPELVETSERDEPETEITEIAETEAEEAQGADEDGDEDAIIADVLEAADTQGTPQEPAFDEIEEPQEAAPMAEVIESAPETDSDTDSIAAKLQRIRAVVSKSRDIPEDDFSEDEHAEPLMAAPIIDEPDAVIAEDDSVLHLDPDMAAAAAAMDAEVTPEDVAEAPIPGSEAQPLRARVIRMKKADFEAAVDTGLLEAELVEEDDVEEEDRASSLSAEEEAELMAELAQVEAELDGVTDADDDDEPVEAIAAGYEAPERSDRARHLTEISNQSDADMARLMQQADTHMEEPDGSRRRQAIAHLRAAVAATKAEKKAGQDGDKPHDAAEVYRDDLASVVRPVGANAKPKRPRTPASQDPRDTPTPLKLVAEQRIDAPVEDAPGPAASEEAPRAPVRPRRVSTADPARADREEPVSHTTARADAGSFSEFIEQVGAHDLQDVLEAAASYLTFVEGLEVFSRPMIVRLAQGMDDAEFSREDSLRGFGQLLRDNKITKVAGGRFTVSDDIGFRPEDRAVG